MTTQNPNSNFSKVSVEIKCSIEGDLSKLILIFSLDKGNTWYSVEMLKKDLFYAVTLPDISRGIIILYSFKAISYDGEEFIEDNNGMYYSQIAGEDIINFEQDMEPLINQTDQIHTNEGNSNYETEIINNSSKFKVSSAIDDSDYKEMDIHEEKSIIEEEKKEYLRPIIPYNPFSPEDGDIGETPNTFQSFSKIIGAKKTNPPIKRRSFIKKAQIINKKRCSKCKANLQMKWRVCPICGTKT